MKTMKITVYTIPDCPFCKQEKDYLTSKGLPFDEKDVLNNKEALAEMLQKSQNFAGVPFTLVEDGTTSIPLKGFTQSEFEDAFNKISGAGVPPLNNLEGGVAAVIPSDSSMPPVRPVDMASTPTMPSSPVTQSQVSSAPVDMPKPAGLDMPTPVSTPTGIADSTNDDPQKELNSLLEDLQTKVDTLDPIGDQPATPTIQAAPTMPATPSINAMPGQTPASVPIPSGMPSGFNGGAMPVTPQASGQVSPQAPVMPDFSQKQ